MHRGRLLGEAAGSGRMAAVELPADQVSSVLEQFAGAVVLAAVNGPASVVIAGPDEAVSLAAAALRAAGASCVPLAGRYAFHSPAVHTHGDELERLLGPADRGRAEDHLPLQRRSAGACAGDRRGVLGPQRA